MPQTVVPFAHAALQAVPAALHPVDGQLVVGNVQAPLALHRCAAVCTPDAQVCPAPHGVLSNLFELATQTGAPVEHEIV